MSDNTKIKLVSGFAYTVVEIDKYRIDPENGDVEDAWNDSYNAIYKCNNVLHHVEKIDFEVNDTKKERWKAQAIFVRSLIYFNMVRAWGAIPYIDKKITYEEAYDYLRTEPATIYENLIDDLNYCKGVLPESWSGEDVGRVTKYGAAAVLAKIYLRLGQESDAQSELEFIMGSNRFSLDANEDGAVDTNDFAHLFKPDVKNCKASILEAQYMGGQNAFNSNHQGAYAPFEWAFHLPGQDRAWRGSGFCTPSENLINEFEPEDPRKELSLKEGYRNLDTDEWSQFPYTIKFYDPDWEFPGQNFEIIRYADILLMYAKVTEDPQYLNMVRSRVGLPAYGSEDYPSDKYPNLDRAIEHERRVELAFEMHRFFDLTRNGRALEVIAKNRPDLELNEYELLWPIPQDAIDVNPELTQNSGY
jgi:hypothetical protein